MKMILPAAQHPNMWKNSLLTLLQLIKKEEFLLGLILVFGIVIRLHGIENPVADHHGWRQAFEATVARNYYEKDFNLLHPMVDWFGDQSPRILIYGLPIHAFISALGYRIWGVHDWIGRGVSIFFTALSTFFLFLLVKLHFNKNMALLTAAVFTILPLNVYFGRAFMPESVVVTFSILGIYSLIKGLNNNRYSYLILSGLVFSLTFMTKATTLFMLLPTAYLFLQKFGLSLYKQPRAYLFTIFMLIPYLLWSRYAFLTNQANYIQSNDYFLFSKSIYWMNHAAGDIYINRNQPLLGNLLPSDYAIFLTSVLDIVPSFKNIVWERMGTIHLTAVGLSLFLTGLLVKIKKRQAWFWYLWLLGFIVYLLAFDYVNRVHDYYQMPLIPVGAFFIAQSLSFFCNPKVHQLFRTRVLQLLSFSLLITILINGQRYLKPLYIWNQSIVLAGAAVQRLTPPTSIVLYEWDDPGSTYFGHRIGWRDIYTQEAVEEKIRAGARYWVGSTRNLQDNNALSHYLFEKHHLLEQNEHYSLFKLNPD